MSLIMKCPSHSIDIQVQILNDKAKNRCRNLIRYESMYLEFSNLKNTCEHYYQKIGKRSIKRKNLTLHQNRALGIEQQKKSKQTKKKQQPSTFQTILKLWKQKRNSGFGLNKLNKKPGIKLRKTNQIELIQQNNQKWRQRLKEIENNRKNIFFQIENKMPKSFQSKN